VLALQRSVGNQRVARALARGRVPPVAAVERGDDLVVARALSAAAAARVARCPDTPEGDPCACELGLDEADEPLIARAPPTGGGAPPPAPAALVITRTGGVAATFISKDKITLTTSAPAPATGPAPKIKWTVNSVSANSGKGRPHTGKGTSFTFKPNPAGRPTSGSRAPNPPIKYRVDAEAGAAKGSLDLEQDETDLIRQEYVDYGVRVPDRTSVVSPSLATFNTGNYSLIVDGGLGTKLTTTETEFATLTQAAAPAPPAPPAGGAPATPPAPVPVPAITVSSAFRNPQRNKAVGSVFPGSRHVAGKALDLKVAGANATLWARLRRAGGAAAASSICEIGPTAVQCNNPGVDHVHIQW